MKNFERLWFVFCGFILSSLFWAWFAWGWIDDYWRFQAVQHGCARFYLDSNHNRQWNWWNEPGSGVTASQTPVDTK